MRTCKSCGISIEHRHYNCTRCVNCQKEHRRKTIAHSVRKYRQLKRKKWYYTHKLGTSDLSEHRRKDFGEEQNIIRKELQRLGLRANP